MATFSVGTPSVSQKALVAQRSAIREVFDAANKLPDAIRLEIGEPSFVTPRFIVEAALEAATNGWTGYTPNGGLVVASDGNLYGTTEYGGLHHDDTNDFGKAFEKIQADTSTYYVLGYRSTNTAMDGHFRQVRSGRRIRWRSLHGAA